MSHIVLELTASQAASICAGLRLLRIKLEQPASHVSDWMEFEHAAPMTVDEIEEFLEMLEG